MDRPLRVPLPDASLVDHLQVEVDVDAQLGLVQAQPELTVKLHPENVPTITSIDYIKVSTLKKPIISPQCDERSSGGRVAVQSRHNGLRTLVNGDEHFL